MKAPIPPDVDVEDDDPTAFIISEVVKPIKALRHHQPIEKPSVDLSPFADSLRRLIEKARWEFQKEKDDLEPRLLGYNRKLEDNEHLSEPGDPAYDYSQYWADHPDQFKEHMRSWYDHYDRLLKKKTAGKPSTNQDRDGGPSPLFLHPVFALISTWWIETIGKPFKPKFGRSPYQLSECNAEARLLHLIVEEFGRYSLANSANLEGTIKRKALREKAKPNRP